MAQATPTGAIIMPPVPAFYTRPQTPDEVVDQTVARALERLDVTVAGTTRHWDGSGVIAE